MGVGNKLSSWGNGSHYLYDAAGNVTQRYYNGTVNMVWNDRYQMSEAYKNGLLAEAYTFDAYGRRVSVSDGQSTTYFIYHGHHVAAEVDAAGQLQRSYTYGAGMDNILSMTIHAGGSAQTYYYLKDHLNTVLALTDESGVVVESYEYDAWGNVRVFDASQTELAQSAFGNRYTFQGREISWATGLYYFRARWYDPVTGRWLSKDPIGISGGLNLYAFCENDPVNNIDPLGLKKTLMQLQAEKDARARVTNPEWIKAYNSGAKVFGREWDKSMEDPVQHWKNMEKLQTGFSVASLGFGLWLSYPSGVAMFQSGLHWSAKKAVGKTGDAIDFYGPRLGLQ